MLKVYFDGSANQQFLVLACLAAEENVWREFESVWADTLIGCGNAPYMHMREAMPLVDTFQGWEPEARDYLARALANVIASTSQSAKWHIFICIVDLSGHARWKAKKQLPAPARMCARIIFKQVLDWYERFDDAILEPLEVFFDRDEPSRQHIQADWNSKKMRKKFPALDLIRTITPADMRKTPPLQAADMVAWATQRLAPKVITTDATILIPQNGYELINFDDHFCTLATAILHSLRPDSIWGCVMDEYRLMRWSYPEEGAAAMHPPHSKNM